MPWPPPDPTLIHLLDAFRAAVVECAEDRDALAVAASGGLDSLAVLVAADEFCRRNDRRLIALNADLVDDCGVSTAAVVHRQVADLGLRCDVKILHASASAISDPMWHFAGPRLDALARLNRLLSDQAAGEGAGIILTGEGADELLGTPRFLLPSLLLQRECRALSRYWRDTGGTGWSAAKAEMSALIAPLLPARWRTLAYWAVNWPELCLLAVPEIVGPSFRDGVAAWTREWIRNIVGFHATHHRSWSASDAWDALFPLDPLHPAGSLPTGSPFLTPKFLAAAQRLPLCRRYDHRLEHAYLRQKSQVVKLFPRAMVRHLPTTKRTFTWELTRRLLQLPRAAPIAESFGLIDGRALRSCSDPVLLSRANAIETWLGGAIERGAELEKP